MTPLVAAVGTGLADLLAHPFVRHALVAGTAIAAASGLVGYFLVLRGQVFGADALSHVAFTGAVAALACGLDARLGLFVATVGVATVLGLLGRQGHADDVVVGTVFTWILGLGALFLSIFAASSGGGDVTAGARVLFGSIFGLSAPQAALAAVIAVALCAVLCGLARPLLFATLDEDVAAARGVRVGALGVAFLVLVGVGAAEATQAVGALLLLGLIAAPAGAALRLTDRPFAGMLLSAGIAVACTWGGIVVGYLVADVPPTFAIVALATGSYAVAFAFGGRRAPGGHHAATARLASARAEPGQTECMPGDRPNVAVITGAASGVGLATARLLAARGWRLVLADVEAPRLDARAAELGSPADVLAVATDVGDRDAVERLADATYERFGRADVVFNNAGVGVAGPTVDATHADWEWVMRVNLWGPIHGVEAFVPRMIAQGGGGHLLFTSSFAGLAPNVGLGPYTVTKYGVVALAEVLYRELRPHDIKVSVLCPMRMATDIETSQRNRPADLGGPAAGRIDVLDPDDEAMQGRVIPVEGVAAKVVDAIGTTRLYIVTHEESRAMVRRRFERIDHAYDE